MTLDLKKLKTRYGGNCSRCKKEIKKDWEVYFSPSTKAVYCLPCGEVLLNETSELEPEDLQETARLDDISLKLDHVFTHFTVVESDLARIIERVDSLLNKQKKEPDKKTETKPENKK